jgi:heat shock protein HtpX
MRVLSQDELAGVIAHELAHVKHRDILISSVAATIAAAIMMAARFAFFFGGSRDDRDGGSPIAGLLMLILGPIAAMLIQMAISRSREFAADAGAARIIGSPHPLVNALRKIDAVARRVPLNANPATAHMFIIQPFTGAALASLFATHPPMDKRIAALLAVR